MFFGSDYFPCSERSGAYSQVALKHVGIEQLEKKVDKHNNFAARMPVVEEQIKVINHRIEDFEHVH